MISKRRRTGQVPLDGVEVVFGGHGSGKERASSGSGRRDRQGGRQAVTLAGWVAPVSGTAIGLSGGRDGHRRRRQVGTGMARNRARARLNWFSQGQRWARCKVRRRAERVRRPAMEKKRRRRVLVVTTCSPRPMRAVQQASNCVGCQEERSTTAGFMSRHGQPCLSMELRMTSSLRIQATKATLFGLPAANSFW